MKFISNQIAKIFSSIVFSSDKSKHMFLIRDQVLTMRVTPYNFPILEELSQISCYYGERYNTPHIKHSISNSSILLLSFKGNVHQLTSKTKISTQLHTGTANALASQYLVIWVQ